MATNKGHQPRWYLRVIKISSAERGMTVTRVCGMSVTGNGIPPFFLYPNVRMNPRFLQGAPPPPGSAAVLRVSGCMPNPNFIHYLKHLASHASPSIQHSILLLIDNHVSHVTLEDIQFCRDNGTAMLGFPPHASHRLQSLDMGFYGPLKTAYSHNWDNFLVYSSVFCITVTDIPKIFCNACLKVITHQTAGNAFRATSIEPFESNIFSGIKIFSHP